ncbi:MAG: ABC transporter permease [Candidatus Dormibacteria bacterium]
MGALWLLARASNPRLRAWLPAVLLMAICTGAVMAAAAGARRTDTAYPRFLAGSRPPDVVVPFAAADPTDFMSEHDTMARISRLPQVAESVQAFAPPTTGRTDSGVQVDSSSTLQPVAFGDDRPGRQLIRVRMTEGRFYDVRRADEAMVGYAPAQRLGLHAGSTIDLRIIVPSTSGAGSVPPGGAPPGPGSASGAAIAGAPGPELTVKVVGVETSPLPGDVAFSGGASVVPTLWLTPAFARQYGALAPVSLGVLLKHGQADIGAFKTAAQKVSNGSAFFLDLADLEATLQSSIHLQALALGLFAALAGAVCLIVIGQAVARQVLAGTRDLPVLRSLGAGPAQLWLAAMLPAAAAALVAAGLAAVIAVLLSPLTPLGVARVVEPASGIAADLPVLIIGAAFLLIFASLLAAYPAWRATRLTRNTTEGGAAPPRLSLAADALARAGLPASAAAGIRMAVTPGGGRSRVPVLAALTGCIIGVAASSAALTFRASLDNLLTTPRLYGWSWDALVNPINAPQGLSGQTVPIPSDPAITAVGRGMARDLAIGAERVTAYGIDPVRGSISPVILDGRSVRNADEIVLGSRTALERSIGDRVTVSFGSASRTMTVVGRGLFPPQDQNGRLGVGAWLSFQGMRSLLGPTAGPGLDLFPVVFASGTDVAREAGALEAAYGGPGTVELPAPPTDLANFGNVDQLPGLLAAVLIVAGVATLAHTLVTAVRRRRRDLAILKTLGFTRRQVASTVAWQSLTLTAIAVVLGLPLGIIAGRWAWSLFASAQGIAAVPVVPFLLVLLTVPAAILLAELVALTPGRLAAVTRPASVLRTE